MQNVPTCTPALCIGLEMRDRSQMQVFWLLIGLNSEISHQKLKAGYQKNDRQRNMWLEGNYDIKLGDRIML